MVLTTMWGAVFLVVTVSHTLAEWATLFNWLVPIGIVVARELTER